MVAETLEKVEAWNKKSLWRKSFAELKKIESMVRSAVEENGEEQVQLLFELGIKIGD